MDKKVLAFFVLMLCHSIFDNLVKKVTEFNVNLDVLYHGSWFCFALFFWYDTFKLARDRFEKAIMIIILLYLCPRLLLNLFSINETYEVYSNLVSNQYIDLGTWIIIVLLMSIKLWQNVLRT